MNRRALLKGIAALAVIPNVLMAGVAKAKNAVKPLVFGHCLNVAPGLIDAEHLVYQCHDGSVSAIEAVRDRGIELAIEGDEPNLAALKRASIRPGYARTCVAEGMIRLGAMPDGPVAIDAWGARYV